MDNQCINLNIHYTIPNNQWDKVVDIYKSMPEWKGFINGFPYWFGEDSSDRYLSVSVEPSGLQIFGTLEDDVFNKWLIEIKEKLTKALGYEIGEPEDGFKFVYWEE